MALPEAEDVRVIQTIGHVDHGKTTFVDSLLAANNIISTRMAGKIRYMDSREDEQQRGITMESSAVSLHFKVMEKTADGGVRPRNYVVNLIDTPGHVDFSSEVSTASRLCDGALVLVDVVEGVCTQTIAVLRQAWLDRLRPILVINKFDRLITELKLAPIEAYHHLSQLIEQVNAVMGSFFAGDRMEDDLRWREERERRLAERKEQTADEAGADAGSDTLPDHFEEKDDEDIYFAPDRGNVIFASALDGWGFRVGKFAQLFATRLGIKEANLRKVLWGDFYLDPKTKRVISYKHLRGRNLKPLFVQFVLDNIWAVYDSIVMNPNLDKVAKIVTTLDLKIAPRDLKSKDTRHLLSAVFSQWLSLSTCTIQAVVEVIPPPSSAQRSRIPKMLYPDLHEESVEPKNQLEANLWQCDAGENACVVAYVSKMFAVPTKELPEKKPKAITAEEMRRRGKEAREAREARETTARAEDATGVDLNNTTSDEAAIPQDGRADPVEEVTVAETLLGFARLYSGTIHINSSIHCVLPKYNNALPPTHQKNIRYVLTAEVRGLYTMMGRELVPVEMVKAGNVFAISGLEGKVWRNATLCAPGGTLGAISLTDDSAGHLLNLGGVSRQSPPIVRVALESYDLSADMPKVVRGLRLLSQSDPCVETFQQQTGEHVILTAGELHLERCLKDLRERFAKVEIQASKPIVPFRETAIRVSDLPPPKAGPTVPRGTVTGSSSHGLVKFKIRTIPLPEEIIDFLQANVSVLKKLRQEAEPRVPQRRERTHSESEMSYRPEGVDEGDVERRPTVRADEFWDALANLFAKAGPEWKGTCERIWSFGPLRFGPNILVDRRQGPVVNSLRDRTARSSNSRTLRDFEDSVQTGFQIATFQGPLCAEPVVGMAFDIEEMEVMEVDGHGVDTGTSQASGSLIPAVKDACRSGMLDWSPRLMLAQYTCDIQASTDVLGKVYATVARRRGRIVAEEMKEGTSFFTIRALLPVVESFGFAEDIRTRTSGAASPQLIFSGYELYDQDPFWVPTTEEELEDLGEKADRENIARVYMNRVRERKGMFVEKKIVQFAEKQRTLKR
ncbi:P-loop containing nucleoside triphosphate hydrolase protein [Gautieria morchelliformis]|nr:P-loop containing nucleoside triphosphate hydrolase protein [Gautieria morchelliformis]